MTGPEEEREVLETVHRALRGLDRREWSDYRSAFADRFHLDYSTWRPDSIGWWSADEWVARVSTGFINDCDATQHSVTNPVVWREDEQVVCELEVRAMHVVDLGGTPDWFELGGTYTWRFEHDDEGRLLAHALAFAIRWRLGNPELPELARQRSLASG